MTESDIGYRISDIGYRISDIGYPDIGYRISGIGDPDIGSSGISDIRDIGYPDIGYRISDMIRISGRISDIGYQNPSESDIQYPYRDIRYPGYPDIGYPDIPRTARITKRSTKRALFGALQFVFDKPD